MSVKHKMRVLALLIMFGCLIAAEATKVPMAKPNCSERCGDVDIPYPFGIGNRNCYLNPYFEITCNGSSRKPYLRKFNLEVLNISRQWYSLLVNNPVYSTCRNGSSWNSSDLSGSPIAYSFYNKFMIVGCENTLLMDRRNEVLAGCTSTCSIASPSLKGCYGINCCHTDIPNSFDFFRLVSTMNTSACTYSFLASYDWFRKNHAYNQSMIESQDHIPVTLVWGIESSDIPGGSGHICKASSGSSIHYCNCRYGYEGNPYIANGCQVVEGCKNCKGTCTQNMEEAFYCFRNRTTEIIIAWSVGGASGLLILILLGFGVYKMIKRRRELKKKMNFFKRNGGLLLQQQLSTNEDTFDTTKIFTVMELEKATDNFNISRVLGQGGQGTVYKGMLTDGNTVAIKKSTMVDEGHVEQFINEVVILSQINHRNIVKLLGCCLETEVPLLVYEFILNGTLSQLIRSHQDDEFPLSWEMRLQIATEVSGALGYLHSATSVPIYHRDIKSSNILIDDKYRAKVADFGTSRSVAIDQTHLTTIVQGTFGYLDPEFFQSSQFTDKSDVYSFGVVLAELLTGENPIISRAGQEQKSLATYFISAIEKNSLFEIIDKRVAMEGSKDEVTALALIARRCLNLNGRQRPTMKDVMFEIERIRMSRLLIVGSSNRFKVIRSIGVSKKMQLDDLNSTSFSDYTTNVSDDSYPLMSTEETNKSNRSFSYVMK